MSRTMESKKAILNKLKEGKSTVTQLSEELGLTKAAISQHLSKLEKMGAVRSNVDPHFKNLKYFELNPEFNTSTNKTSYFSLYTKIAVILVAVLAVSGSLYFVGGKAISGLTGAEQPKVPSTSTLTGISAAPNTITVPSTNSTYTTSGNLIGGNSLSLNTSVVYPPYRGNTVFVKYINLILNNTNTGQTSTKAIGGFTLWSNHTIDYWNPYLNASYNITGLKIDTPGFTLLNWNLVTYPPCGSDAPSCGVLAGTSFYNLYIGTPPTNYEGNITITVFYHVK